MKGDLKDGEVLNIDDRGTIFGSEASLYSEQKKSFGKSKVYPIAKTKNFVILRWMPLHPGRHSSGHFQQHLMLVGAICLKSSFYEGIILGKPRFR